MKEEVKQLRIHQENATTKVAFDCFEEKVLEAKEKIESQKQYIKDMTEDAAEYQNASAEDRSCACPLQESNRTPSAHAVRGA